jgi:hypothetical protein
LNDGEAVDEGLTVAAEVVVLGVDDFEAGLSHEAGGIERGVGGKSGGGDELGEFRFGEAAAADVAVDIDFELADAALELGFQGGEAVFERGGDGGIVFAEQGEFVGREADVITVVRSDDLDASEAEGGLGEQREREEEDQAEVH